MWLAMAPMNVSRASMNRFSTKITNGSTPYDLNVKLCSFEYHKADDRSYARECEAEEEDCYAN